MSYNGWTNYATWLTNLHMFDGLTARDINGWNAVTADEAEAYVVDFLYETAKMEGFIADMINGFLGEVNWREIAEHLNEDAQEGE